MLPRMSIENTKSTVRAVKGEKLASHPKIQRPLNVEVNGLSTAENASENALSPRSHSSASGTTSLNGCQGLESYVERRYTVPVTSKSDITVNRTSSKRANDSQEKQPGHNHLSLKKCPPSPTTDQNRSKVSHSDFVSATSVSQLELESGGKIHPAKTSLSDIASRTSLHECSTMKQNVADTAVSQPKEDESSDVVNINLRLETSSESNEVSDISLDSVDAKESGAMVPLSETDVPNTSLMVVGDDRHTKNRVKMPKAKKSCTSNVHVKESDVSDAEGLVAADSIDSSKALFAPTMSASSIVWGAENVGRDPKSVSFNLPGLETAIGIKSFNELGGKEIDRILFLAGTVDSKVQVPKILPATTGSRNNCRNGLLREDETISSGFHGRPNTIRRKLDAIKTAFELAKRNCPNGAAVDSKSKPLVEGNEDDDDMDDDDDDNDDSTSSDSSSSEFKESQQTASHSFCKSTAVENGEPSKKARKSIPSCLSSGVWSQSAVGGTHDVTMASQVRSNSAHIPSTITTPICSSDISLSDPPHPDESAVSLRSSGRTSSIDVPNAGSHVTSVRELFDNTPPDTPTTKSDHTIVITAERAKLPYCVPVECDTPVCCCTIKPLLIDNSIDPTLPITICHAINSVEGKAIACCYKVTRHEWVRPSFRIPFMLLCDRHLDSLRLHQCCPGCGQFCVQGQFCRCDLSPTGVVHSYHRQCQTFSNNKYYCPHCGEESSQLEFSVQLDELRAPSFFSLSASSTSSGTRDVESVSGALSSARICHVSSSSRRRRVGGDGHSTTDSVASSQSIGESILSTPSGLSKNDVLTTLAVIRGDKVKKVRANVKSLCVAAKAGDLEKVAHMIAEGIDPCGVPDDGSPSAFHIAARGGHDAIVQVLLKYGAAADIFDKELHTPLMYAAESGHRNVVELLIRAGASPVVTAKNGMTVLHIAAKFGRLSVVQALVETDKVNINAKDEGGWTPLIWAAEHKHLQTVKYLLSRRADPNLRDNELNTGLHWAAYSGSVIISEMFLNAGCDLESANEHGDRPLHIAARRDHYDCVRLLLDRHAATDVVNNENKTPLQCCIDEKCSVAMEIKLSQEFQIIKAAYRHRPERVVNPDISKGRETNSISVVNGVDDEPCPSDFRYVVKYVETTPMSVNRSVASLKSCNCDVQSNCSSGSCPCARNSIKCWFDKDGRLGNDLNFADLNPPAIFECNDECQCLSTCQNRVVQLGSQCRLQLFRTVGRGWGCRTLLDIAQGTFVTEYFGELISDHEADRREDDSYLFDLDNQDSETFCIDAKHYGNVSRFINHLCEPNLIPLRIYIDHQDLRFPRMCFFASCNIKANQELGFDYGDKFWTIKYKQCHITCRCGSPKCRYSKDAIAKRIEEYDKQCAADNASDLTH